MTKIIFKRIISMTLVLTLLLCSTVTVFAAEKSDEEYISDLRIVYADDYIEAIEILDDSDLEGYRLLKANLNENTGKTGTWLAYKTTTDIEDAITDISVMQMDGGYNEGNYQEMIKQSYEEYLKFGENYLTAIEYFNMGIDAGHYLSEIAHRQLNFYNVVTEGIDNIPSFEGERLGDIFYDGIDATDLATIFMEGNSYALSNIRSLIAMGVSYNEDGKTYLDKVGDEAEKYSADKSVYDNEDYGEIAGLIAPVITVFRDAFNELEAYESELNYADDDLTDIEIQYMEYMSMANLMKKVNYLNGETLYEFCKDYKAGDDHSELYPFVAALNEGQLAMTKVNHYYDVVRYSVTMSESEDINAELDSLEEKYAKKPFNVYTGVDRTIYRDTFALTSNAYRADAFTESGLSAYLTGGAGDFGKVMNVVGIVGAAIFAVGAGVQIGYKAVASFYNRRLAAIQNEFFYIKNHNMQINDLFAADGIPQFSEQTYLTWTPQQKFAYLETYIEENPTALDVHERELFDNIKADWANSDIPPVKTAKEAATNAQQSYSHATNYVYSMYIVGGLMMLASAIRLGYEIYNYYHPKYSDIPTAMVDLIDTVDGDRYIKYDVVYEVEPQADGTLIAADLNAFQANRWNAMYYTKSYEAGKPLLADEFVVSNSSNVPGEKYAPVHRFGEVVCYNLNKYNFNDNHSIYLSVKQSDNQKAAVKDVPEVIGSVFSAGYMILVGGAGLVAGVGGTIGTMEFIKRRKNKINNKEKATEQASEEKI